LEDFLEESQTNYFGYNGPNLTTNTLVSQIGGRVGLFNEDSSLLVPNHFMFKLSDALALGASLLKLDSSFTLQSMNRLFDAGSNKSSESLEAILDGLRRILIAQDALDTPIGDVAGSAPSRVTFHDNLRILNDALDPDGDPKTYDGRLGTLLDSSKVSIADRSTGSEARNDFGALLSLLALSPVRITADNTNLGTAVQAVWGAEYSQWKLDRTTPSQQLPHTFTNEWMRDRGQMLGLLTSAAAADLPLFILREIPGWGNTVFRDLQRNISMNTGSGSQAARNPHYVLFGSTNDDTDGGLSGDKNSDRIYGGRGADEIKGQAGNDYLEGNSGNDTLIGGTGYDTLIGGTGNDTYEFAKGDASSGDVIIDSDGLGVIKLDGQSLIGGNKIAANQWQSADKLTLYTFAADGSSSGKGTLSISRTDSDDRIYVRNFSRAAGANLGITLVDTVVQAALPIGSFGKAPVLEGDPFGYTGPLDVWIGVGTTPVGYQNFLDPNVARNFEGSDNPTLIYGANKDDRIKTGAGSDVIFGGMGADTIDSGAGDDWIFGYGKNFRQSYADTVYGAFGPGFTKPPYTGFDVVIDGNGWALLDSLNPSRTHAGLEGVGWTFPTSQYVYGQPVGTILETPTDGDNVIDAGEGNDHVYAGFGSDTVHGGTGDDEISGLAGDDYLFGDEGDDWILGDGLIIEADGSRILDMQGVKIEHHGDDFIEGGSGDDQLFGLGGDDSLFGGDGSDKLWGDQLVSYRNGQYEEDTWVRAINHGNDYLDGGAGNDELHGDGGSDELFGGDGDDLLEGDGSERSADGGDLILGEYQGDDYLDGGAGNDRLYGGGRDDELFGGEGNDIIVGDSKVSDLAASYHGNDYLDGEEGNDTLYGNGGNDELFGGTGNDILIGDADDVPIAFQGDDYLDGGDGDDTLKGNAGSDYLVGGRGDDYLQGDAGDDTLEGSEGNDALFGGDGNDTLSGGDGADNVMGGGGVDTIYADAFDTVDGGAGNDIIKLDTATSVSVGSAGGALFRSAAPIMRTTQINDSEGVNDIQISGDSLDQANTRIVRLNSMNAVVNNGKVLFAVSDATAMSVSTVSSANADAVSSRTMDQVINQAGTGGLVRSAALTDNGSIAYTVEQSYDQEIIGDGLAELLEGGSGADIINGGGGNDTLTGGFGADSLNGGEGSDILNGGQGDDVLFGGSISPEGLLIDDSSSNIYLFNLGDGKDVILNGGKPSETNGDTIKFGAGIGPNDVTFAISGSDTVIRYSATDSVRVRGITGSISRIEFANGTFLTAADMGTQTPSLIKGTSGDDVLVGTLGVDIFFGNGGSDFMQGHGGADTYIFGNGDTVEDDSLTSGDTYRYELKPGGSSSIFDAGGVDRLEFGHGIAPENVFIRREARSDSSPYLMKMFLYGTASNGQGYEGTIHFGRLDATGGNIGGPPAYRDNLIESYHFSNGVVWTLNDVMNRLYGVTSGDDVITGFDGDDDLDGLGGDDLLDGGAGNDTYRYQIGGGNDTIKVSGGNNGLRFGSGILQNSITVQRFVESGQEGGVVLSAAGGSVKVLSNLIIPAAPSVTPLAFAGRIAFAGAAPQAPMRTYAVQTVEFADGTIWTIADILAMLPPINTAPVVDFGIQDIRATGTQAFTAKLPTNAFLDNDIGDALTLSAKLDSGAPLPSWLVFDAATSTFSGTPTNAQAGDYSISVTATDKAGLTATANFVLNVANRIVGTSASNILNGSANRDVIEGLAGNDTIDGKAGADTLIGGAGNDTYVVDNQGDEVVELLNEGTDLVKSSVSFELSSNVENLTLTGTDALTGSGNELANALQANDFGNTLFGLAGNDKLTGGAGVDMLYGGDGNDTLDGGAGADQMVGGAGNDTYTVDNVADTVTELDAEGTDLVKSSVNYTLSAHVENLTLTGASSLVGTGNDLANTLQANGSSSALYGLAGNDKLLGSTGADALFGGEGNDTLDGGAGADQMVGGTGNDAYVVDNLADTVVELEAEGTDTVKASVNFTLAANVENLTLTGTAALTATGNDLANVLVGNSAANTLTGYAGNDTLDGGAGADQLIGGLGNDTYVVDDAGDVIVELDAEGTDLVKASMSYTLGANVENLTLVGDTALMGTGNELDNVIVANAANNTLYGLGGNDKLSGSSGADQLFGGDGNDTLDGGLGADTLTGGLGNDTYVIDDANDILVEMAGEGTDTVQSTIDFMLAAEFENLTLLGTVSTGSGNSGANTLIGNAAANALYGFAGNDKLDGKAGADTLVGGLGDDTYIVDNSADIIVELLNEGTDTVQAAANFVLPEHVENLTLTGIGLTGTGNSAANLLSGKVGSNDTLYGLAGNDTLRGYGGADTLVGGAGDDTYQLLAAGDGAQVVIVEAAGEGIDSVTTIEDYQLADHLENATLASNATGNRLNGNSLDNVLTGNSAANLLYGGAGNDTLNGLIGADLLYGGAGDDLYMVDNALDAIGEDASNGIDTVQSTVSYTLQDNVENLTLLATGTTNGFGNASANALTGNSKNNVLYGYAGADVIDGGVGNDTLDGGADADLLFGGDGVDLLAGSAGNDVINSGTGADILLFNRGHGSDTVIGTNLREDVLSLSGIRYADMSLSRNGNDLILSTGGIAAPNDSIKLADWYSGQTSVSKLQVFTEGGDYNATGSKIVNRKIEQFDFAKLVAAFDASNGGASTASQWQISTTVLTTAYLSASDTTALGGTPVVDYAKNGLFSTASSAVVVAPPLNTTAPAGQIFGGL
jgi:trimeric autotransporter adhesin